MLPLRRALNDPGRCQDVVGHRLVLCEVAQSLPTDYLLVESEEAQRRLYYSTSPTEDDDEAKPCHYYRVAFVDGACLCNGRDDATAGIGIAIGSNQKKMQWAIHVDDDIDPSSVRTSQRAELLAAIHGICKLAEYEEYVGDTPAAKDVHAKDKVITSDSEYVVLGMTVWAPAWKKNGWRNPSGRRPKNLDLFRSLDAAVEHHEREYGARIAFWHISRDYNEIADGLAGIAAKGHTVDPIQFQHLYCIDDEMATSD